jgi:hypothetical protein
MKRHTKRVGWVQIDFDVIERAAAAELAEDPLRSLGDWTLSRKSSLSRCKNGSYTLCLIWKDGPNRQLMKVMRGLRLEAA